MRQSALAAMSRILEGEKQISHLPTSRTTSHVDQHAHVVGLP